MRYEDGLAVWDALRSTGVMPVGVETYANTRRMEKSLRLQNADLLTEYNLLEADLARPKVKEADFCGKARHLEYRARPHQPAMLCTIGKNIALAYLPWAYAQEGRKLTVEYFGEAYPVEVAAVGYKPLYDPENLKPRS